MTWLEDKLHLSEAQKQVLMDNLQELQLAADKAVEENRSPSEAIIAKSKEILSEKGKEE